MVSRRVPHRPSHDGVHLARVHVEARAAHEGRAAADDVARKRLLGLRLGRSACTCSSWSCGDGQPTPVHCHLVLMQLDTAHEGLAAALFQAHVGLLAAEEEEEEQC